MIVAARDARSACRVRFPSTEPTSIDRLDCPPLSESHRMLLAVAVCHSKRSLRTSEAGRKRYAFVPIQSLLGLCLIFAQCSAAPVSAAEPSPKVAEAPVSPSSSETGFVQIFNGRDLSGWVVEGSQKAVIDGKEQPLWVAENGEIHCRGKGFGFLRYDKPLKDFVIRLEYRIAPKGNSGIGIRTVKFAGKANTRPSYAGYEIQLLDDAGKSPGKHSTGSLYRYLAPAVNPSLPAGQWNTVEIECRGPKIRIVFNGKVLHDLDQTTVEEIKNKPLEGYFCLQNHGSKVWFRNIQLKELHDEAAPDTSAH